MSASGLAFGLKGWAHKGARKTEQVSTNLALHYTLESHMQLVAALTDGGYIETCDQCGRIHAQHPYRKVIEAGGFKFCAQCAAGVMADDMIEEDDYPAVAYAIGAHVAVADAESRPVRWKHERMLWLCCDAVRAYMTLIKQGRGTYAKKLTILQVIEAAKVST